MISPQDPRTFQTDLGSLAPSCRGNMIEQLFGGCFDFPGRVGSLPVCRASGAIAAEKCPLSQTFPALYDSARRRLEKLSSLEERKAAPESVFTPVSCSKCLRLRRQTSRPAPMASVPESGPCVGPHGKSRGPPGEFTWAPRGNHVGPQGKSRRPPWAITWAPWGNHVGPQG